MFFLKVIIINLIFIKFTHTDLVLCENNECRRAGVIQMSSLFYELDTIKEGHQNVSKLLKDLKERFDNKIDTLTTEIATIKQIIANQSSQQKNADDSSTKIGMFNSSLYDNLWIVIQARQDGSVDFYRNWTEYKQGFGNESGEFFIGLDRIHNLTNDRQHELLVILTDFEGTPKYAHYNHFSIGNENERYRLQELGKYSGTAGNHMKFHLKKFFTTKDRDNDDADEGNCAHWFKGAWWYYNCLTSNLNGPYRFNGTLKEDERGLGVTWGSYDQIKYSYKTSQMLIRAKV